MRLAIKELLIEHTAEVLEGEQLADAITARPVAVYESAEQRNRSIDLGREADRAVAMQLAMERRGETRRHPFASVADALRKWDAQRTDGACIRSAAWDSNGGGRGATAQGDAAQRAAETVAPIARCWATLFPDGWVLVTSPFRVELTPTQARMVAEWAALGLVGSVTPSQRFSPQGGEGARQASSKARVMVRGKPVDNGRFEQGAESTHAEIAAYASGLFCVTVGVEAVGDMTSAAMADLYRMMRDCGLVPRSRKWDEMSAERYDLRGEKSIADFLGVSIQTMNRWHKDHGLPLKKRFGFVVAKKADIVEWENRNTAAKEAG